MMQTVHSTIQHVDMPEPLPEDNGVPDEAEEDEDPLQYTKTCEGEDPT